MYDKKEVNPGLFPLIALAKTYPVEKDAREVVEAIWGNTVHALLKAN